MAVPLAHHGANALDAGGELAHVGAAFLAVTGQQCLRCRALHTAPYLSVCLTLQHRFQLPGQIGGIADALAHALAQKRRLLVGGVARNKNPAKLPLFGHQRVKTVTGLPPQSTVLWPQPARQQLPGALWRSGSLRVFTRQQRNFPAPVVVGANHQGARALRLAILHAGGRQFGQTLIIDQNVHYQPGFVKTQVFQLQAQQVSHRARRTVAADHITGAGRVQTAIGLAQVQADPVAVLLQRHQFGAQRHGDAWQCGDCFTQGTLHWRLGEHHRRCVALGVGWIDHRHAPDQLPLHAKKFGRRKRLHMRQYRLHHPHLLEHTHYFVVQRDGAGFVVNTFQAVTHQGFQAGTSQQTRRHGTRRAQSDYGDVVVRLHGSVWGNGCVAGQLG